MLPVCLDRHSVLLSCPPPPPPFSLCFTHLLDGLPLLSPDSSLAPCSMETYRPSGGELDICYICSTVIVIPCLFYIETRLVCPRCYYSAFKRTHWLTLELQLPETSIGFHLTIWSITVHNNWDGQLLLQSRGLHYYWAFSSIYLQINGRVTEMPLEALSSSDADHLLASSLSRHILATVPYLCFFPSSLTWTSVVRKRMDALCSMHRI